MWIWIFITTKGNSWEAPGLKINFFYTWDFSGHAGAILDWSRWKHIYSFSPKGTFWLLLLGESPGDTTGVALQFCFFLNILLVFLAFHVLLLQDEASGDWCRWQFFLPSTQFHGYFLSSFLEQEFPFSLLFFPCLAPRKNVALDLVCRNARAAWREHPQPVWCQLWERMFEIYLRQKHTLSVSLGTPAGRRSCVGWMSLGISEPLQGRGPNWFSGSLKDFAASGWNVAAFIFLHSLPVSRGQSRGESSTRSCAFSPSLWEGGGVGHKWEHTDRTR